MRSTHYQLGLLAALAIGATSAYGGEAVTSQPLDPPSDESVLDAIWNLPVLYSNKANPVIQKFAIIGRYQGQYAMVDSDQGDFEDWENRRWRLGAEAQLFENVKLKGEINIDEDINPFYKSLEEAYIAIKVSDALTITAGKQKPKWSSEWSTSSRKIKTIERSLLINQIAPKKSTGVTASGSSGKFNYNAGVFSGSLDDEFGELDGGLFYLASIGYDLSDSLGGVDKAGWRFDYIYNDMDPGDTAAKPYEHAFATSLSVGKNNFGLITELLYATGNSPDAYGVTIMPTYKLTDKLELVGRYQHASGDDDGIRAQSRYERKVPGISDGGRGDSYNAYYAGLNYYIYGDKLKLMTGVEYSDLDGGDDGGDFNGWTWVSGVRLYF